MKTNFLAVLVALALTSTVATARDIGVVATPVMLKVSPKEQAIRLQEVQINADILASSAQTMVTMVFYNPNNRVLEGELVLPLAQRQKIIGMALDTNGTMRAAVPVPKSKGQQVFEAVERRQIDPALLEQIAGNQFRLRVYPIPARGTRTVQITFSQTLEAHVGELRYQLPLAFGEVGQAKISINSALNPAEGFQTPAHFQYQAQPNQGFVATLKQAPARLKHGLEWRFKSPTTTQVTLQTLKQQRYFVANIPLQAAFYPRPAPKNLGIVWDASLSRRGADIAAQLTVLAAYFQKQPNANVVVYVLRGTEQAQPQYYRIERGDWSALKNDLQAVAYDGASNSGLWRPVTGVGEYWLFADGSDNLYQQRFPDLGRSRLYVFNPQAEGNHQRLRALAQQHHGEYHTWHDAQGLQQVQTQLWQDSPQIVGSSGDVAQVVWPSARVQNGMLTVLGQIKAGSAAPRLQLQLATAQGEQNVDIPLQGRDSTAVARLWAGSQIDAWASDGERNREQMAQLGQQFGMVTPETSLLVLDGVADYVEHDITPPPELQAEYRVLQQQKQQHIKGETEQQLTQARRDWQAFGQWWQQDFPKDRPKEVVQDGKMRADAVMSFGRAAPVAEHAMDVVAADAAVDSAAPSTAANGQGVNISIQPYQDNSPDIARLHLAQPSGAYRSYLEGREHNLNNPSFYLAASDILWEKGLKTEAVRVASNLAEMKLENRYLLRLLAQQFMQFERPDLAVDVLAQVLHLAPEEPQSYRDLALAQAATGQYQTAADLLYSMVKKPWDSRFGGIQLIAVDELNQLVAAHAAQINVSAYDAALLHNRPVDLRVVLTWDSDNSDMDLWVSDPNGEKVYYAHPQSYQGGRISRDFTGGYGPEVFWLKQPKLGEYEVRAHFYGDRQQIVTGPTTAHVRLIRYWGKPNQSEQVLRVKMEQDRQGSSNEEAVLVGKFTVQ